MLNFPVLIQNSRHFHICVRQSRTVKTVLTWFPENFEVLTFTCQTFFNVYWELKQVIWLIWYYIMNFRDYYLYYESTLPASNIRIVLCYCSFLLDISNQPWCLDKSAILRLSRHGLYTLHTCILECPRLWRITINY